MEMPVLDLINFDQPMSIDCKYVLTSPRSLKACRRAGVKPVELLFRSREGFEEEYISKDEAQTAFEMHENDRQRKLELCKSIRSFLIQREECKKEAQEEINNNIPDTDYKIHNKSYSNDSSSVTILPTIEETGQDVRNHSPIVLESPPIDETITLEESNIEPFPLVLGDESYGSEGQKSSQSKKRSVRICDKRTSRSNRSKSRESRKMPKIGTEFWPFAKMSKENYIVDPDYRITKFQQVINNSVDRELKLHKADLMQKELELGLERWQDRILVAQWAAGERAQELATRELEVKVQRLQEKNRMKHILHVHNLNKVKEAEDYKAEGLRRQIQYKDMKIHNLHQERERIISESRIRAQSVADLRQQVRDIMMPETFDQKVSKYSLESKVMNAPVMGYNAMQTSHFHLG